MHSYLHNIKTFNNATMHLTHVERGLYRCLIDLYYDTEQPLPAVDFDRLARRVMAHSDEEKEALRYVLGEFFELTGDVYTNDYCDNLIDEYHNNKSGKSRAGKASAEARRKKAEARKRQRRTANEQNLTGVEQVLNSVQTEAQQNLTKQETINQKPLLKDPSSEQPKKFKAKDIDLPLTINQSAWVEWCEFRSSKRKPISERAAEQQIKMLSEYSHEVQTCIIRDSIQNDYQGLFKPKGGSSGETRQSAQDRRIQYAELLTDYEKATDF